MHKYEHAPNLRDHECPFYQVINNVPSVTQRQAPMMAKPLEVPMREAPAATMASASAAV